MFFSKCFPTNTSMPSHEDEQTMHQMRLSRFPAGMQFSMSTQEIEDTVPYSYLKEELFSNEESKKANIEKILEALRNNQYRAPLAWDMVLRYPDSPALYLFVIAKLRMEDAHVNSVVTALKAKKLKIKEELRIVVRTCFDFLGQRSAQEAWDYGSALMSALNERRSVLRLAVSPEETPNTEWQAIYDFMKTMRFRLEKPTPPEKHSCFPRRG